MNMHACALFDEQKEGPSLLSVGAWFVLGKRGVQAKKVYCLQIKLIKEIEPLQNQFYTAKCFLSTTARLSSGTSAIQGIFGELFGCKVSSLCCFWLCRFTKCHFRWSPRVSNE